MHDLWIDLNLLILKDVHNDNIIKFLLQKSLHIMPLHALLKKVYICLYIFLIITYI
jgi:hypothetical protein